MIKIQVIITRLCLCATCAIAMVAALLVYARKQEGKANGFNRNILTLKIDSAITKKLTATSFYIAGLTRENIVLGNNAASGQLQMLAYDLGSTKNCLLDVPDSILFAWGAAKIYVSDKGSFLAEGITPRIFSFKDGKKGRMVNEVNFPTFDQIIPGDSLYVFRTYDSSLHRNILAATGPGKPLTRGQQLLISQQDGAFSTDGMLLYDKSTRKYLYVYRYRNGIVSFKSSLEDLQTGNTIDTNTQAKLTLSRINSEREITFSAPPLRINKHACVDNGRLFIYSGLRGDNEHDKPSYLSSAIDVYAVNGLKYLYSFYVPDYKKEGIRDMAVRDDRLVLLKGYHLTVYKLHL
jgi:hypothetical protein